MDEVAAQHISTDVASAPLPPAEVGTVIAPGRPIPGNAIEGRDCDGDTWYRDPIDDDTWVLPENPARDIGRTELTGQGLSERLGPFTVTAVAPFTVTAVAAVPFDLGALSSTPPVPVDPRGFTAGAAPLLDVDELLRLVQAYGTASYGEGASEVDDCAKSDRLYAKIERMLKPREPRRFPAVDIEDAPADLLKVRFVIADHGNGAIEWETADRMSSADPWFDSTGAVITWRELRLFDLEEVIE